MERLICILVITVLTIRNTPLLAQPSKCDCNHFPEPECVLECLKHASESQLQKSINLDSVSAKALVTLPNRKSAKNINSFKAVLPKKIFDTLYSITNYYQNNSGGVNLQVGGNNNTTNIYTDHPEQKHAPRYMVPELHNIRCAESGGTIIKGELGTFVYPMSVGEAGKIILISDTSRRRSYNYEMSTTDTKSDQWENWTNSQGFKSKEQIRLCIYHHPRLKIDDFSFDIFFADVNGKLYYQRAKPSEENYSYCTFFEFTKPKAIEFTEIKAILDHQK